MVGESVKGLVLIGLCAAAAIAGEERGTMFRQPSLLAAAPLVEMRPPQRPTAVQKPVIRGGADAKRAWLGAEYRGLVMQKFANKSDGSLRIEVQFLQDHLSVAINRAGGVAVERGGRRVEVTSAEAYESLQQLLGGSHAAFAVRVLLAERESVSDLQAPEMSLLSTAAFLASLSGDVDAPRRLSTRFVEKHRGIYRPVRLVTCFDQYTAEVNEAWNDMQRCMDEANQDPSLLNRAYRRVACNGIWLLRSESAWVEFLGCLGPGQLIPQ